MSRSDDRKGDRARRIMLRLVGSTQSLDESAGQLDESRVAERLHQIEQLFLLHGGERGDAPGPDPGSVLFEWGHLQVLELLGDGSFGDVYRAYDRTLDRDVALKLLKTDQGRPFQSQLFLHEARQLALVRHRNVLAVHGAAVHDGRPGLWTDLIGGNTAHHEQYRESFTRLESVLELIESLALALQAVHSAGLVHGDVKPSNIMRDATGEWILMDFGASLDQRRAQGGPAMTSGTPLYMAPDVVLGKPPSVESDLYSMGATLYRLLVGRAPVEVSEWPELKSFHDSGKRPPSARHCAGLDARVARLIDGLMAVEPSERPVVEEVLARVQSIREAPQRRFRVVALSSIAGVLLLGLTLTSIGFYRANEARIEAEQEQRNTAAVNGFLQRILAAPSTTGRVRDLSVEDMLRRAADDVAPLLREQPAAEIVVHRVLAESFNTLRLPQLALSQIEMAHDRLRAANQRMPEIERGLDLQRIRAAEIEERHEDSIALAETFVATYLDTLGDDHMDIRWARKYMVTNRLSLSRHDEAEEIMRAYFQDVPEPETAENHFGYEILQSWANLHRMQGRYQESVASAERALDWLERYPLSRPVNRLGALTNLALNLGHLGQSERAIEVLQEILPIQERMFGAASGEYLGTLVNISAFQRESGRVEASAATLTRARELILENPDSVPPEQAMNVSGNLANVLNATGEQARGEALIRELIAAASEHWSPEHVNVLKLEYNLAELMNQQGRFEEAQALAEQTLAKKERALGPAHAFTLLTMDNLAVALAGLGHVDQALDWHDRAASGLAEQVGPDHAFTLLAERHQVATLQRLSPEKISADLIEDLIRRHEQSLGADHPDTDSARALATRTN